MLYSKIVEIDCRVIPTLPGKCELKEQASKWRIVDGDTGEKLYVTKELDRSKLRQDLKQLKDEGIDSIAVALAHSYTYKHHELEVGEVAKELGRLPLFEGLLNTKLCRFQTHLIVSRGYSNGSFGAKRLYSLR